MITKTDLYVRTYDGMKARAQRIVRYFSETHMGNGHRGLCKIANKEGVDIRKLTPGEYVIFMNTSRTSLKMFAAGNVIAHLKMPNGGKIDPRVIALLPRFFTGKSIDYDSAMKKVLEASLR